MDVEVDVVIIGAGVIGLAVASELAIQGRRVVVFEKNHSFGQETSSRNSEVIHAGIYYPEDSLKAKLCVEGNRGLYELCGQYGIPHKRTGKIVLAVSESEIPELERIYEQAKKNGVTDLELLSQADIKKLEPNINARAGILSPSTGIVDAYSLMSVFHKMAVQYGAEFLFETEVIGLNKIGDKWEINVLDWEGVSVLKASVVINCAGLNSEKVAKLSEIDNLEYKLYYCKGEYFSLSSKWRNSIEHLIYPIPEKSGLGIHATLALDGMIRLGPNARYITSVDYKVDSSQKENFYQLAKRFIPKLECEELIPDFAGIRPKLQGPNDEFRDFVITHEEPEYYGLINLIGIESPGLTASPAIACHIGNIVKNLLSN